MKKTQLSVMALSTHSSSDSEGDLAQQLKATCLSKPNLPRYSPPKPPPLRLETTPQWKPGTGGTPYEPLPDLEAEQKFLRFRTAKYRSTAYQEPPADEELEERVGFDKSVPLLICKDVNEYILRGIEKKVVIEDTTVIIDIIKQYPELGFLYLKRCTLEDDPKYNPYFFAVCNYFDLDRSDFCTISPLGFAEFSPGGCDYAPLEKFERDYKIYQKLVKFDFFSKYYLWKHFSIWIAKKRKQRWLDLRQKMSATLLFKKHPHYKDNVLKTKQEDKDLLE